MIIQIVLAYAAAVIVPMISIYVLERRSLDELEARCDGLWVGLSQALKKCKCADSGDVAAVLDNYAYCREVGIEKSILNRGYLAGGLFSLLYFGLSLNDIIKNLGNPDSNYVYNNTIILNSTMNMTVNPTTANAQAVDPVGVLVMLAMSAIFAYLSILIVGSPSTALRSNVERFAASVTSLASSCLIKHKTSGQGASG